MFGWWYHYLEALKANGECLDSEGRTLAKSALLRSRSSVQPSGRLSSPRAPLLDPSPGVRPMRPVHIGSCELQSGDAPWHPNMYLVLDEVRHRNKVGSGKIACDNERSMHVLTMDQDMHQPLHCAAGYRQRPPPALPGGRGAGTKAIRMLPPLSSTASAPHFDEMAQGGKGRRSDALRTAC